VLEVAGDRLRTEPSRAHDGRVTVSPAVTGSPPRTDTVRWCLDRLRAEGHRDVHTAALGPAEQEPFLRCGFVVHERLHLLEHDLVEIPSPARPVRLRRGRHLDRRALLAMDHRCFPPYWQIDQHGLRSALRATAVARLRVATDQGALVGYAVTGRSLHRGYLQRLAVDPDHQGRGLGRTLVSDALGWSRRRGARTVVVNTQEHNDRALALYEHLGFTRRPDGLAVLSCTLESDSS
jgi:ribosomal protein S18 acetylase RimI-like enzyme